MSRKRHEPPPGRWPVCVAWASTRTRGQVLPSSERTTLHQRQRAGLVCEVCDRLHCHENFHQTNAAGTPNVTRKTGNSSATEYPARATPTHVLTSMATNQTGMKICAAVTMDRLPPNCVPRSARTPSRASPPSMITTLRKCPPEVAVSLARYWALADLRRIPAPRPNAAKATPARRQRIPLN